MERLAIKGHSTRGSEVVAILEMYGGINKNQVLCDNPGSIYFIGDKGIIVSDTICSVNYEGFNIFTLEDYLKEYPFKVGEFINITLDNGITISDEIMKLNWYGKERGSFIITKRSFVRAMTDVEYIVPGCDSSNNITMKLYRVIIKTYHYGTVGYELFVLADSEESMYSVVNNKIRCDDNAEIVKFEEIDLSDTTNRVL